MDRKQLSNPVSIALLLAVLGIAGTVGAWAVQVHAHSQYVEDKELEHIEADLDLIIQQLMLNNKPRED